MSTQRLPLSALKPAEKVFLLPTENSGAQPIELSEFLSIGRDNHSDLELADPFVSVRHARIEKKPEGFLVRDLRSQNGTFVNGMRVVEAYLNLGDRIRFGQREFIFYSGDMLNSDEPLLKSKNEAWAQQLRSLPLFAKTDLPVLLLGSSGTGKEVLAKLTHDHSTRNEGPFVSVNCSALSESLIESELFGHTRGSFTGATHDRKGAFESARGGTLFLDEIGDLPLSLQPKLLRALENREIRPVGSDRNVATNVRIIAATHKNLSMLVSQGSFRADLFFRLHVIRVTLPDLKDRMEDFDSILYSFSREMRVRFSFDAIQSMKAHSWPGNIRELRNVISRASALFPNEHLQPTHLKLLLDTPHVPNLEFSRQNVSKPLIREIERELIIQKLAENGGNQRKTALDLGLPKSTLHDRIRTYAIDIENIVRGRKS